MNKTMEGFILAPIAGAFVGTIVMLIVDPGGAPSKHFGSILFICTLVGAIFGWIIALVIGFPLFKLFQRFGWNSLWQYCLGGVVCVIPFWVLWFYPFNTSHWEAYNFSNSLSFFVVGIVAASVFWFIRVFPEQHSNKEPQRTAELDV